MKIFICCSKYFYHKVPAIKVKLEMIGHRVTVPNSFDEPFREEEMKNGNRQEYIKWKSNLILREDTKKVKANDAILVLNFKKNGQPNYIGGATFIEIFLAFSSKKKIFLYNPIPKSIFTDELTAMNPTIIKGDLSKIK